MRERRQTIGIKVMLSPELAEALEHAAREMNVGKGTLVRLILVSYLKPWLSPDLQPRRLPASPVGPGAKGLEVAGPEGRDEAHFEKERGGESG
jgi:hypothetical protein